MPCTYLCDGGVPLGLVQVQACQVAERLAVSDLLGRPQTLLAERDLHDQQARPSQGVCV